jgi:hypothetical protein
MIGPKVALKNSHKVAYITFKINKGHYTTPKVAYNNP